MKFETRSLHGEGMIDSVTGASSTPIYQASTFHQADFDHPPEYDYARSGNPTRHALEALIASMEGVSHGFAFASGIAAMTSVLLTLKAGDHVIACEDLYGGTFRALTRIFSRLQIATTFVDAGDADAVKQAIKPNTRMLLLETPSNPTLKIIDLRQMADIAQQAKLITVVDNTFMSPYLQRPHELGIDIVVHSGTKFLGGHSDVLAGLVTVNDEQLAHDVYQMQNGFGAVLSPYDSWLLMRGMKTLAVRMKQSQETAHCLALYLQGHDKVQKVYYPGLPDHPMRDVHFRQAAGAGAVLSFVLEDKDAVKKFVSHLSIPLYAVSLGAVESIVSYPARMSHAAMPPAERYKRGITDGLLRLSVGLEDADDLLSDLQNALDTV